MMYYSTCTCTPLSHSVHAYYVAENETLIGVKQKGERGNATVCMFHCLISLFPCRC